MESVQAEETKGGKPGRKKGSVSIVSSNDRLQLHFRVGGKRHYLSLGLTDTVQNRKLAEAKAKQIESDIAYERFDPTLVKYKPQFALSTLESAVNLQPNLKELWSKFLLYKEKECSPNTMSIMYKTYSSYLDRLPEYELAKADEIVDFIQRSEIPKESAKRFITRLSACCDWAKTRKLITYNPFQGKATKIKIPKAESNENDIYPFSADERDRILEAIRTNQFCPKKSGFKHSRYYPLLAFLFKTGCRPSEAIALQWKHISSDFRFINFEQRVIHSGKGKIIRKGLKTQEKRRFVCNGSLQELLKSIKPENANPESLIFPSPEGGYIDTNNFRNRTWKTVLAGLEIEYRKLYQTRHTFITLALEHGLDAKDVARLVGNSAEIIYQHYAGNKRDLEVPEF